jgi:uncharacterized membrane protein
MHENLKTRFWEVDLLRGLAIVMMVVFHFFYDLSFFGIYQVNVSSGFWFYFARTTAGLFIILVGVSLVLSSSRAEMQGIRRKQVFVRFLKRGLWIFFLGLLVTVVTYFLVRDGFIVFGILHFIGISIILAYPFLRLKAWNLVFGAMAIVIGFLLQSWPVFSPFFTPFFTPSSYWLLWLGIVPEGFYTLDYIPVFPWFGAVLIGIFLGNALYGGYRRRFTLPDLSDNALAGTLCLLGRNSLFIYLIHQPLIVAALILLGDVPLYEFST